MSCPHSSAPGASPETCSLCVGAKPRIVVLDGPVATIDGEPVRSTVLEAWAPGVITKRSQRRGGRR